MATAIFKADAWQSAQASKEGCLARDVATDRI
jgi:hypothetical protein